MAGGDPWSSPETVAGFVGSPPNAALLELAAAELRGGGRFAADIGCGAARNAVPLANTGWIIVGTDTSAAMLDAASRRARSELTGDGRLHVAQAAMDALPLRDRSVDMVVAHGIWNLARSSAEFRRAVREGGRIARPGAALFLFTFSRSTLPAGAEPIAGETFVFSQFSGGPQIFLTREQVVDELAAAGFAEDAALPLRELNRPANTLMRTSGPVIHEGAFRRQV